ncbi:hypothetical protein [Thiohalomonas denitrificans]|uniref:hypothetical protein n=1 Tax=Thiohalomonas denitrificans TaxID=415747 RepID=UPI0026EAB57B|nr:hypothetical protein [Thiohalomonas denitrificans]
MATEQETGMRDEHYDIVSTLYHALQGADICKQYIADAEKDGDKDAADFFHEVQDQNRRMAEKAKQLLVKRVH